MTDTSITNNSNVGYTPAACCCARYHTVGTNAGDWYLGAGGEMSMIVALRDDINTKLTQISAIYSTDCVNSLANNRHWSSTESSTWHAYVVDTDNGDIHNYTKGNNYYVIAMLTY